MAVGHLEYEIDRVRVHHGVSRRSFFAQFDNQKNWKPIFRRARTESLKRATSHGASRSGALRSTAKYFADQTLGGFINGHVSLELE